MTAAGARSLAERVAEHDWYHTIELAPGVVTPGWFDTRAVVDDVGFPSSLEGKRCLDIGTFDGFWATEMERRGAAEVVAIDVIDPNGWDWPVGSDDQVRDAINARKAGGAGFELVQEALGSRVERHELSVYDLDESLGSFDFVYFGSLLLHLQNPIKALERAASVCRGELLLVDAIDLPLTVLLPNQPVAGLDGVGRPWWWRPNAAGLRQMVQVAGMEVLRGPDRLYMPYGPTNRPAQPPLRSLLRSRRAGIDATIHARKGDPHAAVLARPRR
jgi:tRNA (mo5U34)-methyltransferase